MERNSRGFGSSQFRVKYRETPLLSGPSGISGYIGTLRKGAVLEVLEDAHPYYFLVRLDNGLEGYVYKGAGELTSGLSLTRLKEQEMTVAPPAIAPGLEISPNGATPDNSTEAVKRPTRLSTVTRTTPPARPVRPASRPRNGASPNGTTGSYGYSASSNGARNNGRMARTVVIITGEIAVFSKPGIVGQQVGKLRRGEQVSVLDQDSFFFQVSLPNGQVGFIPRYAAEPV